MAGLGSLPEGPPEAPGDAASKTGQRTEGRGEHSMGYTMTFDASHKVGRGGGHVQGFVRHIARDVDLDAGFQFAHANTNIVPDRTARNFTRVNDGAGAFRVLRSVDGKPPSEELEAYLNIRLGAVTKSLRKDAVVMRGIILQLDPKWFDEHNPDWRENGLNPASVGNVEASLDWACHEFSQKNIVGFSIHLDEYNPQLQVMMTPVTDDGRLSQKDFFKGPLDFKRQHVELREHMETAGYDVEHRVTERSREHLSSSEFQAKADRMRDATQDAEDDKATYETLLVSLENRKTNLDSREDGLAEREQKLAAERSEARRTTEIAHAAERSAKASQLAAQRAREEAERERDQLRATNERLEQIAPDVERWLDKAKFGGKPVREYYNDAAAKARATRAEAQRLIGDNQALPRKHDRQAGD